ncbi:hypothetical protein OKW30_006037 [Paraburkholderia sp. Clong3]|uniref:hypothetical protein n=1 Tax=Paraburkholderia sp. Clong3 TaxID=2991061 RepID=UPI003D1F4CE4
MVSTSGNTQAFEKELLNVLRFGGLDDDNLSELVTLVAGFYTSGFQNIRVFPRGIPPVVDGLTVKGVLDTKTLSAVLADLVTKTPRLSGVWLFPYGVPVVDVVGVTVELGATVQQSSQIGY